MSDRSAIEWTDASWNPLVAYGERLTADATGYEQHRGWHCEHVSEGCRNCFAEAINRRLGTGRLYKPGNRSDLTFALNEKTLLQPLHWRKPRKIFVGSMTDLFGDWVTDEQLDRIFAVMALCPQHTFQVLTKRPERMRDYLGVGERKYRDVHPQEDREIAIDKAMNDIAPAHWCKRELQDYAPEGLPLPNVWLGVSCEDQATADERIPLLLDAPAAVRFISAEPLLGPINLTRLCILPQKPGSVRAGIHVDALRNKHCESQVKRGLGPIDWVIVGGESGPGARPMHTQWARGIREQCKAAGAAFFFKQWGEWAHEGQCDAAGKRIVWLADCESSNRIGKKRAGRLLDGVEHNEFPQVRA